MRRTPPRRRVTLAVLLLWVLPLVASPAGAAPRDGAPTWSSPWSWLWSWFGGSSLEARVEAEGLIQDPLGRLTAPLPPPHPGADEIEREALEAGGVQDPYGRASQTENPAAEATRDTTEAGLIQDPLG